jgi:hypothetical protein
MRMSIVIRGPDPRVHLFRKMMDCGVKPGNDEHIHGLSC